jgi:hypothetical protein
MKDIRAILGTEKIKRTCILISPPLPDPWKL